MTFSHFINNTSLIFSKIFLKTISSTHHVTTQNFYFHLLRIFIPYVCILHKLIIGKVEIEIFCLKWDSWCVFLLLFLLLSSPLYSTTFGKIVEFAKATKMVDFRKHVYKIFFSDTIR